MASVEGLRIPASSGRRLWPAQAASQRLVRRLPPYAEPPWGRRRPGSGGRQGARSALRPRAPTIGELLGQRAKRMGPSMGTGGDLRAGAPRIAAGASGPSIVGRRSRGESKRPRQLIRLLSVWILIAFLAEGQSRVTTLERGKKSYQNTLRELRVHNRTQEWQDAALHIQRTHTTQRTGWAWGTGNGVCVLALLPALASSTPR